MSKSDVKTIIKTAVSLFLICAVAAGLLAFVNSVTAPRISENNAKAAEEAKKAVLPSATAFSETTDANGNIYSVGTANEETIGYVFTTSASGYGGVIEVMTGIDAEGNVTGISILTINETPGLGMNANKDSFRNQYNGKSGPFTVAKNEASGENEILALTSATITSDAVTKAVNEAIAVFNTVKEG